MPSIYDFKPAFQRLLRPMCAALARNGLTANQVTVAAAVVSAAVGAAIALAPQARWPLLVLPAWLFLRMALNALDGMLAREFGQQSRLGALLNEVGDVVSDTALYLPLALVPGIDARLVVAITVLAIISELAGLAALLVGSARRYDGPMGKSDRAFAFGLIGLLLGLGVPGGWWITVVLGAVIVLLGLTVANRMRRALATQAK